MSRGASKYNDLCEDVRILAEAKGVLLVIAQGKFGNGAACRMKWSELEKMPALLREIANQIEADLAAPHWPPFDN